jgi:transcriptional regulator with PAS, ATPase and Fis domain
LRLALRERGDATGGVLPIEGHPELAARWQADASVALFAIDTVERATRDPHPLFGGNSHRADAMPRPLLPAAARRADLSPMAGDSTAIRQLKADIAKIAPLDVPVLIVGESGTGKELAAQAIHALGVRADREMVFVNAAALPPGLVESELFGYEGGAFTGAERVGRRGKFELAHRSSLFFDEVGDMPAEVQVKLLRVLQDGMFERVGSNRPQHSDFRLVSATNRDFQQMIQAGQFRLDLYYRISGVTVRMPSLRERLEDLPLLLRSFLDTFAKRHGRRAMGIGKGVIPFLAQQPWPGNVRQLLHEVEKAAIFCDQADIEVEDFRFLAPVFERSNAPAGGAEAKPVSDNLQDAIAHVEKTMIVEAMKKHRGNKKRVAEELGISRAYLYKKLGESAA